MAFLLRAARRPPRASNVHPRTCDILTHLLAQAKISSKMHLLFSVSATFTSTLSIRYNKKKRTAEGNGHESDIDRVTRKSLRNGDFAVKSRAV
jgi:hypothetical protein